MYLVSFLLNFIILHLIYLKLDKYSLILYIFQIKYILLYLNYTDILSLYIHIQTFIPIKLYLNLISFLNPKYSLII
jgi:hypothetical protein